jgi:hypothetical protein
MHRWRVKQLDTSLENQFAPDFDADGNVKGGKVTRSDANYQAFRATLDQCAERYPMDPSDIVMPEPGWPVDADGRGLTVLEHKGIAAIKAENRDVARYLNQGRP